MLTSLLPIHQPTNICRYSFPLEDPTASKQVLDRMLETSVPVLVKEFFAVSLEFCKQFHDLIIMKEQYLDPAPVFRQTSYLTITLNMTLGSSVTGFYGMRMVSLLCIITYLCIV